jgi:NTE family protein
MPEDIEVHLVPTLCPLAVSPFDFTASQTLIERAARSSQKWIDEGGLERRALPQELAPHRHGRAPASSPGASPLTAG